MNKELQRIADNISNYDPKEWDDISKADLQADYDRMREICDCLTIPEIKLLWYLRHSGCPQMIYGLLKNARKNYEAVQAAMDSRAEMSRISSGVS